MAEDERASRRQAWEQIIGPLPAPAAAAQAEERIRRATEMPSWHKAREGSDFFEQRARHDVEEREQRAMQRTASGRETLRRRRMEAAAARAKSTPRAARQPRGQTEGNDDGDQSQGAGQGQGPASGGNRSSSASRAQPGLRRGGSRRSRRGELDVPERRLRDSPSNRRFGAAGGGMPRAGDAAPGQPALRASESFRTAQHWASLYGEEVTLQTKQAVKEAQEAAERADEEARQAQLADEQQ